MANIGTFNNQDGAIFQDNSVTIQQNNMQFPKDTPEVENNLYSPKITIHLKQDREHRKVDFFRVIMALLQAGFFVTETGIKPDATRVFQAFGQMLGEDFSKFANNLAAGSQTFEETKENIFNRLSSAFKEYEQKKEDKMQSRR